MYVKKRPSGGSNPNEVASFNGNISHGSSSCFRRIHGGSAFTGASLSATAKRCTAQRPHSELGPTLDEYLCRGGDAPIESPRSNYPNNTHASPPRVPNTTPNAIPRAEELSLDGCTEASVALDGAVLGLAVGIGARNDSTQVSAKSVALVRIHSSSKENEHACASQIVPLTQPTLISEACPGDTSTTDFTRPKYERS
jgi:hypothetical protein